ncbi:MAG: hypothetical protein ACJ74O_06350 [Frankiaceae bacterium]
MDVIEGRLDDVVHDSGAVIIIEVEALVEGGVQLSPHPITAALVEAHDVAEQRQAAAQAFGSDLKLAAGVGQAVLKALPFDFDGVAALHDLAAVEQAVGR